MLSSYFCIPCQQEFYTLTGYRKHIFSCHVKKAKVFVCFYYKCENYFADLKDLKKHFQIYHKDSYDKFTENVKSKRYQDEVSLRGYYALRDFFSFLMVSYRREEKDFFDKDADFLELNSKNSEYIKPNNPYTYDEVGETRNMPNSNFGKISKPKNYPTNSTLNNNESNNFFFESYDPESEYKIFPENEEDIFVPADKNSNQSILDFEEISDYRNQNYQKLSSNQNNRSYYTNNQQQNYQNDYNNVETQNVDQYKSYFRVGEQINDYVGNIKRESFKNFNNQYINQENVIKYYEYPFANINPPTTILDVFTPSFCIRCLRFPGNIHSHKCVRHKLDLTVCLLCGKDLLCGENFYIHAISTNYDKKQKNGFCKRILPEFCLYKKNIE